MLISYNGLCDLVAGGIITNVDPSHINGSSIDITLGKELITEKRPSVLECPECMAPLSLVDPEQFHNDGHTSRYCMRCKSTSPSYLWLPTVDPAHKDQIHSRTYYIEKDGYRLPPGHNVLAHSQQMFNLPNNITAEYRLKSSMARVFLEHLHAGWCDPGWHGSVLTLEFSNMNRYHNILLTEGMKCGQVCFYEHPTVPANRSYAVRGQYNKDTSVSASKGSK